MKNNRENKRIKCFIPATLIYNNRIYPCTILNLSDYGCQIKLKDDISINSLDVVNLNFSLDKSYLIQGKVDKNISTKDKRIKFIYKDLKDKILLNHELHRVEEIK